MSEQPAVTTDESTERNRRRTRTATVVSDRMEKTVVVQVSSLKQHPLYKKTIQRRVKFKAHDESNQAGLGDIVRVMEVRPISKEKRWLVVEIIQKAK